MMLVQALGADTFTVYVEIILVLNRLITIGAFWKLVQRSLLLRIIAVKIT
jgi:hypothetical protein